MISANREEPPESKKARISNPNRSYRNARFRLSYWEIAAFGDIAIDTEFVALDGLRKAADPRRGEVAMIAQKSRAALRRLKAPAR